MLYCCHIMANNPNHSCVSPPDLAALIKERSRNVERLEGALERQSTESERRIQDLNEQLSAARARHREATANGTDEVRVRSSIVSNLVSLCLFVGMCYSLNDGLNRSHHCHLLCALN
jgi:hypothetical protein